MPTARELLQQADALMRRNRAQADDDIPVLTDAVPSALEAQSHFAPKTRQVPDAPALPTVDDEVPILTDAVEEIEAVALVPASEEGERSAWLDFDEGEPSVIGDAPDSIAIVPPVDLRRPEPTPDIDEFDGLDEELAAAIAAAPREEESLQPPQAPTREAGLPNMPIPEAPMAPPEVIAGGAAALLHQADIPPAVVETSPPAPSEVIAGDAAAPLHEADIRTVVVETPPTTPPFDAFPAVPPLPMEVTSVVPVPFPIPVPEPAPPAVVPSAVDDAAHWDAMAEEIRMQVLQRIDLFTDTGLRTQLGERLQPIVDRASADLVATINSHVGELLRAYVAEAIEREIESWRKNH